jgi:hypothetical protein
MNTLQDQLTALLGQQQNPITTSYRRPGESVVSPYPQPTTSMQSNGTDWMKAMDRRLNNWNTPTKSESNITGKTSDGKKKQDYITPMGAK